MSLGSLFLVKIVLSKIEWFVFGAILICIITFTLINTLFIFRDAGDIDNVVRLGDYKSRLSDGTEQVFSIEKIIRHEDYDFNPLNPNNDIALVKVFVTW